MPRRNHALGKDAWEIAWPRWMTTATCARYIDRTEAGIRGLVRRGAIPFVKRDGLVYFDRVVIDRWMMGEGKRRLKRTMAIKKRNGRWIFVQKIGGKLHRVSTGYPVATKASKEAAARRATEIELDIRARVHGWTKDVPMVERYWTATYRPTYTLQKRAPQRDDQVMAHALPFFGSLRLDAVKKSDCERYLNQRRAAVSANPRRKTPGRIAEGTVQRERSFLHALFQQAVEDQLIERNPWRGVERQGYAVRERLLTEAEQAELLRRLSPRFQRFVLFLLGTGVRLEECRGIEPTRDLYLPERWVRVTGKFGKTREVPLPAALVPVIEQQLAVDGQLWKQNPQRLREVLSEACAERKNKKGVITRQRLLHLSPHTLRHTFGWRWLKAGGDIYTLSRILGHGSVAVTEKHYAHLLKEDLRSKADAIDLGLGLPTPRMRTAGKVLGWKQ
jgi:integrase